MQQIQAPGTLDGGDVLVIGRQVFVGSSARTNRPAIDQLSGMLGAVGYTVRAVPVRGCLHLKSAATAVAPDTLLINRRACRPIRFETSSLGIGYTVRAVPVRGCLHLKSAATAVAPDTLLINRACVPADAFRGLSLIDVDPEEPHAANGLAVGDVVIYPASFPRTRERLERRGLRVRPVEVDELQKAEGAVTCCSLIFDL